MRTTYNIFLLSRNSANQNIAQVTLTQMVDHIFRRIRVGTPPSTKSSSSLATPQQTPHPSDEKSTPVQEEGASFQDQIIVEANMARSEMGSKLPSGKASDNSEEFLNDTANVFNEEPESRLEPPPVPEKNAPSDDDEPVPADHETVPDVQVTENDEKETQEHQDSPQGQVMAAQDEDG